MKMARNEGENVEFPDPRGEFLEKGEEDAMDKDKEREYVQKATKELDRCNHNLEGDGFVDPNVETHSGRELMEPIEFAPLDEKLTKPEAVQPDEETDGTLEWVPPEKLDDCNEQEKVLLEQFSVSNWPDYDDKKKLEVMQKFSDYNARKLGISEPPTVQWGEFGDNETIGTYTPGHNGISINNEYSDNPHALVGGVAQETKHCGYCESSTTLSEAEQQKDICSYGDKWKKLFRDQEFAL